MKFLNSMLWKMMFLVVMVPPTAFSASSGSSPWSDGSALGNVGPTQSGPGAAGLFTPNSPGNSAAYDAQLNGGLVGSPIVDGNGANLRVTVPSATPSGIPNYHDVSSNVRDQPQSRAAEHVPASASARGYGVQPMATASPYAIPASSSLTTTTFSDSSTARPMRLPSMAYRRMAYRQSAVPNLNLDSKDPLSSIGDLTGSITYPDGQITLLGTAGNATIDSKRQTLFLPNGQRISMKSAEQSVRQSAVKNQVQL